MPAAPAPMPTNPTVTLLTDTGADGELRTVIKNFAKPGVTIDFAAGWCPVSIERYCRSYYHYGRSSIGQFSVSSVLVPLRWTTSTASAASTPTATTTAFATTATSPSACQKNEQQAKADLADAGRLDPKLAELKEAYERDLAQEKARQPWQMPSLKIPEINGPFAKPASDPVQAPGGGGVMIVLGIGLAIFLVALLAGYLKAKGR